MEKVIGAAALAALNDAAGEHLLLGIALFAQIITGGMIALGRIAQPKPLDGAVGQSAAAQIAPCRPPLVGIELLKVETGGILIHCQDAAFYFARVVPVVGQRHPGPGGQKLHRLYVVQVVDPLDKSDGVPARPAAEAVKAGRLGVDHKGRGLFTVERAEPGIGAPPAAELDIAAHQLRDIGALRELLQIIR